MMRNYEFISSAHMCSLNIYNMISVELVITTLLAATSCQLSINLTLGNVPTQNSTQVHTIIRKLVRVGMLFYCSLINIIITFFFTVFLSSFSSNVEPNVGIIEIYSKSELSRVLKNIR